MQTGATVSFVRAAAGEWGIEIARAAAPRILQPKPAMLTAATDDDKRLNAVTVGVQIAEVGLEARLEKKSGVPPASLTLRVIATVNNSHVLDNIWHWDPHGHHYNESSFMCKVNIVHVYTTTNGSNESRKERLRGREE